MRGIFRILRQELDHLLRGVANLHTDHGIHGYGLASAHKDVETDP